MTFDTNAWIGWILAVLCLIASPQLGAAPPAVIYLSPAGAQRGTTVEVIAAGSCVRWPVQVGVSGNGVVAKAAKEKGRLAVTVTADAIPGVYWLRLHDELGASGLRPFVVGTLPEVAEKEPNDDPKKPQPVALPAVVNGRLDKAGDVDCFAVSLKKGQTLVAELEAHHTLRSPMDGVLQIVSPEGFVLDENHDFHGLDPLLGFTALKDGIYIVRVFAFPATPDSSIRFFGSDACIYRLTLTTGGYADHAWPLAAPRAAPGMVALVGWNIPEAARALPVPASGSVFHPAVANPVAVRLEPHPCRTAPVATGPLVPPVTLSGRLALPSQADTFSFSGAKGKPLVIQIE